jgi:cytochrome c oxidase subunit 2
MRYFWGVLFGVVLLAAFLLTALAPLLGWWLPRSVSTYSGDIDRLYYWILGVVTLFFVLTEALLVYIMIRWAGEPGRKAQFVHGNHRLEMLWTVVPGVILFLLAILQINVWADIKYPSHMKAMFEKNPEEFLQMEVTTRQWEFRVRYPSPERIDSWKDRATAKKDYLSRLPERIDDIHLVNDVHTWKGQKTICYLRTRDVGHSFFVPAMRVKQDALPGRTIPLWFEPTEANTRRAGDAWQDGVREESPGRWVDDGRYVWDLVCTQYCGSRHSLMRGKLYVHATREDYLAWLKKAQEETGRTQPEKPADKVARGDS